MVRLSFVLGVVCVAVLACAESPIVREGSVSLYRPDGRNVVYVDYELEGAPGVVTAEIYEQGVALGLARSAHVTGDIGRVVQPGVRRIVWTAAADYPNRVFTNAMAVVKAWATNAPPDYLVVDLAATGTEALRWYDGAANVPGGAENEIYKTSKLLMRKIPAAGITWVMGSPILPTPEAGRTANAETPHYVTFTEDYYMGVYPVTAGQYKTVIGSLPANADVSAAPVPEDYALHPVSGVSYGWQDVDAPHYLRTSGWPESTAHSDVLQTGFLGKMQSLSGGMEFDLPTSAQWEYACRAGSETAVYGGYSATDVAWCSAETNRTVAVGLKQPNAYGLYDMLGNVWEWCLDIYPNSISATPVTDAPQVDPVGIAYAESGYTAANQVKRVRRGSNYSAPASDMRAALYTGRLITGRDAMLGFRVFCPAVAR